VLAKFDFNDMLKQQGDKAIKRTLMEAITITKVSELGERKTSLVQDFLRLKEKDNLSQSKSQISLQQEAIGGIER
jgi:hypothetical protein